jgi:hypothetical protein
MHREKKKRLGTQRRGVEKREREECMFRQRETQRKLGRQRDGSSVNRWRDKWMHRQRANIY